jgi:hypothetical protein
LTDRRREGAIAEKDLKTLKTHPFIDLSAAGSHFFEDILKEIAASRVLLV